MTQKIEENERQKKAYSKRGERSQRMFNFRMDNELYDALQDIPNKGRFVNEAIREKLSKERKD